MSTDMLRRLTNRRFIIIIIINLLLWSSYVLGILLSLNATHAQKLYFVPVCAYMRVRVIQDRNSRTVKTSKYVKKTVFVARGTILSETGVLSFPSALCSGDINQLGV